LVCFQRKKRSRFSIGYISRLLWLLRDKKKNVGPISQPLVIAVDTVARLQRAHTLFLKGRLDVAPNVKT